jgi:hypothetical protein
MFRRIVEFITRFVVGVTVVALLCLLPAHAAGQTSTPTSLNSPADFSIYAAVVAPNPVPFGFNISPSDGDGVMDNHFIPAGGITPWDARLGLTATQAGTATTFICDDSNEGTDFWASINSGFFVGALTRIYRFTNNAWTLLRTDTISEYSAIHGSTNPADHTITFSASGPPTQQGDVIWMSLDGVSQVPSYNLIGPSHSFYALTWNTENASSLTSAKPTAAYTFDASIPPNTSVYNGPAVPGGLSLKLTDSNTEQQGIYRYIQPLLMGTYDGFETGHTYELSLWLKQSGVANGSMTFRLSPLGLTHTFTGITGNWQKFTWAFNAVPNSTGQTPSVHFDFNAPGTMWYDNIRMYDTTSGAQPDSWDPRQFAALQAFAPGTMRIWSNFSSSAGSYQFWSLDSWLADEEHSRSNFAIGAQVETDSNLEHLPTSLAYAKDIGTSPWLIVNMSLSEQEWSNLIDYLCAPAGQGYAVNRPANHPGPYTADFSTIYVEFGNEEWGTQYTPVNGNYGQWMHYMLSQAIAGKSYFDSTKIKFIGNSFTKGPSFASTAAVAAPEVSVFDYYNYVSGNTSLTGDAYYQSDLLQLPETNKALIDAIVSTQQADAMAGHPYQVAAYEGGPGDDTNTNSHIGDTSLAAGVMTLDVDLYSSQQGFGAQNLFLYSTYNPAVPSPYTTHSTFATGLVPHPVWEALQMRNQHAHGPMVLVGTNQDPVSTDGMAVPLIATYAFHDTSGGSDVAEVFVLSRDLNNTTPVTLHFPGVPTSSATLYTLTGDPRGNNDSGLMIPVTSSSVTMAQNYTFNMPPGSVYLFVVPTSVWSTAQPLPATPTGLAAIPGASDVSLSWAPVSAALTYNVKRSLASGGPYTTIGSPSYAGYKDAPVTNGTTYYYVVTAVNAGGESPNSNEVAATPNVATVQYTATPPPMDGTAGAVWNNVPSYPYQHKNAGNTPDTGTFKLLWDNSNLYVLATIMDSSPAQSTSVWNGDSVEIYIDGNDSKPTTYGANDFQYAFPWNGTTVTESKHNATQGVVFGQTNIPGGYQMTMSLPWSTLKVASPAAGYNIGFDTMVNDANPANTLVGKIAWWATTNNSWQDPALFGNATLATPSSGSTNTLLAYEPFNSSTGSPGPLEGVNDGSGWGAPWVEQTGSTAVPGYDIASGTPLLQGSLMTQGNYAVGGYNYGEAGRALDVSSTGPFATAGTLTSQSMIGTLGNTIWESFLLRSDANANNDVWVALHPSNGPSWYVKTGAPLIAAGFFGGSGTTTKYWTLNVNGTLYPTNTPVVVGQTVELVLSISFGTTSTVQLYVNPVNGALVPPTTASASASTTTSIAFQDLTFTGGTQVNQASVDEIRLGTSFSSVTPVTVAAVVPTISFTVPNETYGVAPFTVAATSNSTGAINYSVVSGPATISASTVTITGPGVVVLQASQSANGNYSAATQNVSFTVAAMRGDLNGDGQVDLADLHILDSFLNKPANGPNDPRDLNHDGVINALDARILVTLCTYSRCATRP